MKKVIFPSEHSSWPLIKEQLLSLRELSLQDGCDLQQLAEMHQVAYDIMHASGDYVENSNGNSIMYGLMKFLSKHASLEERELFLKSTFPGVIDLALKSKDLIPSGGVDCSIQQQENSIVLNRQLIASILACGFLCLFPNKDRGRGQKLDTINFTQFFTFLSQSQIAKLRCILNYFERVLQQQDHLTGNVTYTRQVLPLEELPTLDTWLNCSFDLCHLEVHQDGLIEDAGCEAMEVDFANRYIGGGVLRNGRVQEEIRFSVCPELIVSRLFMEYMEENEAIVIEGYEQFSKTEGYASSLLYVGDFKDPTTMDTNGNLQNKLCAIDAISYRHGNNGKQYTDQHLLRDLNKAFAGFCTGFNKPMDDGDASKESGSSSDEDYHTASESLEEDNGDVELKRINALAEELLARVITLAIPEAVDILLSSPRNVANIDISIDCDTRNEKSSMMVEDFTSLEEECYNDGKEHLEVNFREWLSRRRRSSNLSDLSSRRSSYDVTSRRSSCSTRYSSEFSSEFEEMYENFQIYDQKYKYHTIKEELRGSVVNEFASNLALQLLDEVAAAIGESDFCVLDFRNVQPVIDTARPHPLKFYYSAVEETTDCVPLAVAEKYVDELFKGIWPFPVGKDPKLPCQLDIRHILSHHCNKDRKPSPSVPVFPETACHLSEDEPKHVDAFLIINKNHTEGSEMPSEENLLLDAANNLVYQVIQEAMNEYEQMYLKKDLPRLTDLQYLSSVSCTIDCTSQQMDNTEKPSMHSSVFRDEREIDFSDSKDKSLHSIKKTESAAYLAIADKLVTDAFSSVSGCTCKRDENDSESRRENYSSHVCDVSLKSTDLSETKYGHHSDQNEIYSKVADSVLQSCLSDVRDMNKENDSNSINLCSIQHGSSFHQDQLSIELSSSDTGTSSDQSHSSQKGSSSDPNCCSGRIAIKSPRKKCSGSKLSKSNSSIEHSGSSSRSDKSVSPHICSDILKETSSPVPSSLKVKQSNSDVSSNVKNTVQKKIQFDVDVKDEPKTKDSWTTGSHKYLDQYFNVLSRDLVTNAFLEVQGESVHFSNYPRRSSEPIHLSNGAVRQRLAEHACDMSGSQMSLVQCRTDEDLGRFAAELARYRSSTDIGKEHRRRSTGFRDPVLSRFAEELMKVNVKTPSFLPIDNTNRSTSGSSQSGTSNISGFRDPLLASFEEELVNTSCVRSSAKSQNSSSRQKVLGRVSQQKSLNVDTGNSMLGTRVLKSTSFDSHTSGLSIASESGSCCLEAVSIFAKDLASRILIQSLSVFPGTEDYVARHKDTTVVIFSLESYSNNLARQIITTAVHELSVVHCKSEFSKSDSIESHKQQDPLDQGVIDTSMEKADDTEKETRPALCSTSLSHDFEDALDIPFPVLEQYANCVADQVLVNAVKVWKREEECRLRRMCGRPIATGNWGCGAFGGDPHLKSLIQWMAASYAGTPVLMYYTFNNPQMIRLQNVVDIIKEKNWTVGHLMQAVRRYCFVAQDQIQQQGFISDNLFDILIFNSPGGTAQ